MDNNKESLIAMGFALCNEREHKVQFDLVAKQAKCEKCIMVRNMTDREIHQEEQALAYQTKVAALVKRKNAIRADIAAKLTELGYVERDWNFGLFSVDEQMSGGSMWNRHGTGKLMVKVYGISNYSGHRSHQIFPSRMFVERKDGTVNLADLCKHLDELIKYKKRQMEAYRNAEAGRKTSEEMVAEVVRDKKLSKYSNGLTENTSGSITMTLALNVEQAKAVIDFMRCLDVKFFPVEKEEEK